MITFTIFLAISLVVAIGAFAPASTVKGQNSCLLSMRLAMIGGMGWGNDDYLSSLGGSDEEKKEAKERYDEFRETREAFIIRQQERMNSPSGQKFLQQLSEKNPRENVQGANTFFEDDALYQSIPRANESRFQNMMRQAAIKKMGRSDVNGDGWFVGIEQEDEDGDTAQQQ